MIFSRRRPWRTLGSVSAASPLRVQFVITSMPVGGAETLLVNMLGRMDPSKLAAEVICLKEPGTLGEQIADEFPVHSNLIGAKWDVRVLFRLAKLMHRRRADAVITVGAGDKMFWGRLAAHVAGVPVIASALHSTGWPDGVGRMNRLLTPITDAFIGVAESHGKFLHDFERFPKSKVHVVRNGVDTDRFAPDAAARQRVRDELGLPEDAPLIGIVAALRSEKNHGMFVAAAGKLRDRFPDAHWIVVGDGPERENIENVAAELDVTDRVHLLGTRHDTPELVAALDVFALSSLNEASPVSILEALACGVPVVATDVGSIAESIVEGETGMLVASEDQDGFAAAIATMLTDEAGRQCMGFAGRKLVQMTGSLDAMVSGYESLVIEGYRNACEIRQKTRPVVASGERRRQHPAQPASE